MKVFQYEDKEKKEKAMAVDVDSMLQGMQDLEESYGVTQEKILDNWYELKRQLREVLVAQLQAEQAEAEKVEKDKEPKK